MGVEELQRQAHERLEKEKFDMALKLEAELEAEKRKTQMNDEKQSDEKDASEEPPTKQIKLDLPETPTLENSNPDEHALKETSPTQPTDGDRKIVPIEEAPAGFPVTPPGDGIVPIEDAPEESDGQVPTEQQPHPMAGYWRSRWKPKIMVNDGQYCRLETGYQTIFYGAEMALEEDGMLYQKL